ncbi:LysR substrate-binding domain-containing protein [Mangrovicoccus algicola]|uniref:LysR family transcriptional regulator n=1 Tax=Mangrovicoccus algicola TaxID=2771008 RepID=A0A8J6YZG1_9RHOB|nr:LysR substrate-binding domain-containing protein [Mangrovicoccus algicola]MBE3638678.1 LysR family transcriptional regulator [Mangrovicoccus algicola]
MARVLDLAALRALVTIADLGGVTRAANVLNLTQSAVSMQMKRLEESLDVQLLNRQARSVSLTSAGEQLAGYARRMLELNDEAITRLTTQDYEGRLTLGVPHDIVYPHIPGVMQRFAAEFPRVKVHLVSSYTVNLLKQMEAGSVDVILTTQETRPEGCETLATLPMVWIGAQDAQIWRARPLRLAFEPNCLFRAPVQAALEAAGIPWDLAVEADHSRTIEASVAADFALQVVLRGTLPPGCSEVPEAAGLPALPSMHINMYRRQGLSGPPAERVQALLRAAYGAAASLAAAE